MKQFWNERYANNESFYGEAPNRFFKTFIDAQPVGRLLLPAEGEGRNALYAATNGWAVEAFDFSEEARNAAAEKAEVAGVMLHYELKDIEVYRPIKKYDAIALIFAHQPPSIRIPFHQKLIESLEPGGYIIMECFSKQQVKNNSGGPKDIQRLYDVTEIRNDFAALEILICEEAEVDLAEGDWHKGNASVIHFVGRKPA